MKKLGGINQVTLTILVIVVVFLGTLIAIFAIPPEEVRVESEDGRFRLRGLTENPEALSFMRRDELTGPFSAITSPVYELGFSGETFAQPLLLTVTLDRTWGDPSVLEMRFFDERYGAWRQIPSVYDPVGGDMTVELFAPASLWALSRPIVFDRPIGHDALLNEATAFPPEGAIGYHAFSAVALISGDFVLLERDIARGGCNGVFLSGQEQTLTTLERPVGDAIYRIGVIWELNGGCQEGVAIQPLGR